MTCFREPCHRIGFALVCATAAAFATGVRAWDLTGSATETTEYVFRGISQSGEEPAFQVGAKLAHESGVYGSTWASNVDYGDAVGSDAELDFVVGWSGALAEHWTADLNLTQYTYPGTHDALDLDYQELIGTLTWRDRAWTTVGWSNDVFASGEPGTYVLVGGRAPLTERFRLEAVAAWYALDDAAYADDYGHAMLNAVYAWKRYDVRATAHWTTSSAEALFGDMAEARLEVAASVYF